ncbi:MAG: hypothetical protein KBS74_02360 [Clostridiales bacterium]|nr:hypothetical protein [Candidatus Cacconaster stercorequi]
MKNSPFKFLSIAILIGVVVYFAAEGYQYITDPFTTTLAYPSQSAASIELDGWMIRSEETFSSGAVTLSHVLGEGAHVGAGQTIAIAYQNEDALKTVGEIEEQELQLQQLEFAMSTYLDADAALKLDSSINDSILQLQGSVSRGDYSTAADDISALKAAILKRSHTYSSNDEIQANIDTVKKSLRTLRNSLSNAQNITAPKAGTYSAICDGYETTLTPKMLKKLKPSRLDKVKSTDTTANVGKLIYGSTWYYAANVTAEQARQLTKGQSAKLHFAKGFEQDIPVTVYRISAQEDGRQTVILTGNRYIAQTTQLRHQQAELILATYSGIRVPANALRMNEEGQGGVYCVVGMTAQFKPAEVVYQGDGYTLIKPTADAAGEQILRTGDEVIITAAELEVGKVIEP